MRIKWKPKFPATVEHLGVEWQNEEIKDVPDDLKIRVVNNHDNAHYMPLVQMLLSNANFVIADTDKNPNFTCAVCGIETRETATYKKFDGEAIEYKHDGKRVCPSCFTQINK